MKQIKAFFSRIVLNYLRFFAKKQIKKINPQIIGITGTAGKTSAMNAIGAVLSTKYKVKLSIKANSESGIPANILGLEFDNYSILEWIKILILTPFKYLTNNEKYDYYIAEMGIDSPDEPKNMSYLLKIIKPDISVFLNVYPMHSLNFDKLVDQQITGDKRSNLVTEKIAIEKGKIITSLDEKSQAVVNTDNEYVYNESLKTKAKVWTFGETRNPDLKITGFRFDSKGTYFKYQFGEDIYELELEGKLLPKTYAYTFASAILVGQLCEIDIQSSIESLSKDFILSPGRSSLIKGKNDTLIIDSSYNSSLEATESLIDLVANMKAKKKVFVAGDMRELGSVSAQMHEKLAKASHGVFDHIVTVGPETGKYMVPELIKLGFDKQKIHTFEIAGDAARFINSDLLVEDTLFLIKGSQNTIFLEIVVESLMLEQEAADSVLCRRGKYWDERRREYL